MAGVFSKSARPRLAGSYFNWEAEAGETLAPSTGGIVAVPMTGNWGPIRSNVVLESFDEYVQVFGAKDCPLKRAVYGAFKGEGRPGKGGAGAVLVYRMGTGASAPAVGVLNNTAAAAALTLTAKYQGTRGNDFRRTTQPSAVGGKTELLILDGSLVVEKFTFNTAYSAGDAAALKAEIDSTSDWFNATVGATGVALATVSAVAFAGGNDGEVLTSAEWLQATVAFDAERWAIVAPYGLTDPTIRAALVAWLQQRNLLGRRSLMVLGGAAAEVIATANARSTAMNDWNIVNLGIGTLHLDDLNLDVGTAEMVTRVAGSIANRGETRDLIYARFQDVTGLIVASLQDEVDGLAAGTTVFSQDTHADAPVFIKEGVTTYAIDAQSPVDENGVKTHPVALYKRIKNLRIQHAIEVEVEDWFTSGDVAGALPVNDRVRALAIGFMQGRYQAREDAEIVQPGWTVELDTDPPADDDDDFIQLRHGFHPTRSLRQLFNTVRLG